MTMAAIQAGKNDPWTFRIGSQPAATSTTATAVTPRNATGIPRIGRRRRPLRHTVVLALASVTAAGCAQLPVPPRAPYTAAPPSSSAPWRPPIHATPRRPRGLARGRTGGGPDARDGLA